VKLGNNTPSLKLLISISVFTKFVKVFRETARTIKILMLYYSLDLICFFLRGGTLFVGETTVPEVL